MPSFSQTFIASALVAVAHGQGVILSAQGAAGSPASLPFQVKIGQADANIINATEVVLNAVNECGRTLLGGNIDIGENTEIQLSNKTVTSVTKGSSVTVTIEQGDANGAGPFTCDMDVTGNAEAQVGQIPLNLTETDANGITTLKLTMPSDMACVGASTGNVCTIRCRNNVASGPFGGCFAVQQTDITPKVNTPENIASAQSLQITLKQQLQNQADLAKAIAANANTPTTDEASQGVAAIKAILGVDSKAQATVTITSAAAAAAATGGSTKASKKASKAAKASAAAAAKASKAAAAKASKSASASSAAAAAAAAATGANNKRAPEPVVGGMRWAKRYVVPNAGFQQGDNGDQ